MYDIIAFTGHSGFSKHKSLPMAFGMLDTGFFGDKDWHSKLKNPIDLGLFCLSCHLALVQ